MSGMSIDAHREHHRRLHQALDELLADWIAHQPMTRTRLLQVPLIELLRWSHEQTVDPTHPWDVLDSRATRAADAIRGGGADETPA